jgi:Holliday junction resolvase RusA-like endonuclease
VAAGVHAAEKGLNQVDDLVFDNPPAALFFVPGVPQPGGSKRAFVVAGRAVVTEDCKKSKPWRAVVALCAEAHYQGPPLDGPLSLEITFTFPRPAGHYGTGKRAAVVRASAPKYPTVKPDTTKLIRSLEDALKGVVWRDDSQVVEQTARKIYGDRPGALVCIRRIDP